MRHRVLAPVVLALLMSPSLTGAQVFDWASIGIGGVAGNGDAGEETSVRAISADGRYVVFHSWANNLVAGDLNGFVDVFRHDRMTGNTVRVSVSDIGVDAAGESKNPSISADGRYVAFASTAADIVPGDGNSTWDVFVRDMDLGVTERASVSSTGGDPDGESNRPSISADGSLVVFSSVATNLVPGFATTIVDIYLRDLGADETTLVSIAHDGGSSEANSWRAKISPDGSTASFASGANDLVPGDGGNVDVFLRNLTLGQTFRISVDTAGGDPNDRSGPVSLSHDGRVAAFWSRASDLVPSDTNGQDDIFVWDADVGVLERINLADDGSQAMGGGSWNTAVSGDGRYVVFMSDAENLVPEDSNGWGDIFAYDRQTETIELLSFSRTREQGDGFSRLPSITPEGNTVVFESSAGNFVDGDTNALMDVYVGHGPAALWVDGFESGSANQWSPPAAGETEITWVLNEVLAVQIEAMQTTAHLFYFSGRSSINVQSLFYSEFTSVWLAYDGFEFEITDHCQISQHWAGGTNILEVDFNVWHLPLGPQTWARYTVVLHPLPVPPPGVKTSDFIWVYTHGSP